MRKYYFLAGLLLTTIATGTLSSCSSDDEPTKTPDTNPEEEKTDTIHLTLQLVLKGNYKPSIQQKTSKYTRANIIKSDKVHYRILKGDRLSIYQKGTADKLGTVECVDGPEMIFKGDIIGKDLTNNEEFYVALDNGEADNIKWDGTTFTFANPYSKDIYNGISIVKDVSATIAPPTGSGSQIFYECGKGTLNLSDSTMTAYIDAFTPLGYLTFDSATNTYVQQKVKENGYTVLTLKYQTNEPVLEYFTFKPEDNTITSKGLDRNVRTIYYDPAKIQWEQNPMLIFSLEPGMWNEPTFTLYGGTDANKEMEQLATVTVPDMYKKLEFIAPDLYNKQTSATYQRPLNRIIPYGSLVKE